MANYKKKISKTQKPDKRNHLLQRKSKRQAGGAAVFLATGKWSGGTGRLDSSAVKVFVIIPRSGEKAIFWLFPA
jgi:hypothetical protein